MTDLPFSGRGNTNEAIICINKQIIVTPLTRLNTDGLPKRFEKYVATKVKINMLILVVEMINHCKIQM